MIYCLPWTPSVNHYWRYVNGRPKISREGRQYRSMVVMKVRKSLVPPLTDKIITQVMACPPDNRRRDLDNLGKVLFDSLKEAGVYVDDSQIDDMRIIRGTVHPKGFMLLRITPLPPNRNPWGVFPWAMSEEATRALRQGGVQLDRGLLDVPAEEDAEETEPAF